MESWVGMKRDCFVRQSTITNIAVCPSDAGSCSIKSIEMDSHGRGGIGSCLRKPYGLCLFALECAHTVQDQMYCLTIRCRRDISLVSNAPIGTGFGPQNITVITSQESHHQHAFFDQNCRNHFPHTLETET